MKTIFHPSCALLAGAALFLTTSLANARSYGVSSSSRGRGTEYTSSRGGTAYVGPRGAAAEGANGRSAAVTERGAAYSGPNAQAATGRYGNTAVRANGETYTHSNGTTAYTGTTVVTTRPVAAPLPAGYIRTVPAGYTTVVYGGYNCCYVGGVYYRPVFYGGDTVYVVVH